MDIDLEKDPQICFKVWKSSGWVTFSYGISFSLGTLLIIIALIVFGEGRETDQQYGYYLLAIGIFLMISFLFFRKVGKELLCVGINASSMTLWVHRESKGVISRLSGAGEIFLFGMTKGHSRNNFAFQLSFLTKEDPKVPQLTGAGLYTKSDAKKVTRGTNEYFEIGLG